MTMISEHAKAAAAYCHEVTLAMDWGREYPEACEKRIQQAIDAATADLTNQLTYTQAQVEQVLNPRVATLDAEIQRLRLKVEALEANNQSWHNNAETAQAQAFKFEQQLFKAEGETKALQVENERLRELTQWQPIDTAPKEGKPILLAEIDDDGDFKYICPGYWDEKLDAFGKKTGVWGWKCINCNPWFPDFTHWMPLPKPPAREGEA